CPLALSVPAIRSLTNGTQPPQPVPALVHFFIPSMVVISKSVTAEQIAALLTASHEQIRASSGRLITPAPSFSAPPLEPNIKSSGLGGRIILLLTVCSSML